MIGVPAVQRADALGWHLCDEGCPIPGPLHRAGPSFLLYPQAPRDCAHTPTTAPLIARDDDAAARYARDACAPQAEK